MSVINILISTLTPLNYPVYLQGTFSGAQYPESFITYFVNSADDRAHYDDKPDSFTWNISVIFYTKNPLLIDTAPETIRETLIAAGFIPRGKGFNTYSDDPDFVGWANEYLYIEK